MFCMNYNFQLNYIYIYKLYNPWMFKGEQPPYLHIHFLVKVS